MGRGNLACPCFIAVFGGPYCVLLWRLNRARTGLGDLDLTAGSSPRSKKVEVGPSRVELKQLGGVVGAEQLGERKVENRDMLWWGQREALDPELGLCLSSAVTLGVG